jgi:hypothetical protein|eukprot:scaffold303_cov285-Chaetoceros_neogracile.AAC.17
MKASITALTLFAVTATTSAFAPATPAFTRVGTPLAAEAEAEKQEVVLDTNFDDVNIVKLLGLARLKKKARKNKSKANDGK